MSSLAHGKNGVARSRRILLALAVPVALTLVLAHASSSTADELGKGPAFGEIWQKSQSLRPQPSTDTTPVLVENGTVTYRIPRNYIILYLGLPTLKLTYPGFKPLSDETRRCFDPKIPESQSGCTTLELRLSGGRGPDGLPDSNARMFNNFLNNLLKYTPNAKPKDGPSGYKLYEVGPEDARIETYRKDRGDLFFHCDIIQINPKLAVCDDTVFLSDGNAVKFFFRYDHIKDVEAIEVGIRDVMSSFVSGGTSR